MREGFHLANVGVRLNLGSAVGEEPPPSSIKELVI